MSKKKRQPSYKLPDLDYARAMQELRRSSATSRHTDQHAEAKKHGAHNARGGRRGVKQFIRSQIQKEY